MRIVTFHEGSEIELIFIFNKATITKDYFTRSSHITRSRSRLQHPKLEGGVFANLILTWQGFPFRINAVIPLKS